MTNQPDLLSAFVQAAYQKISIEDLFNNPDPLHTALVKGMPLFEWSVITNNPINTVHISATLDNVKESWTISLALTKGRSVSKMLDSSKPTFDRNPVRGWEKRD